MVPYTGPGPDGTLITEMGNYETIVRWREVTFSRKHGDLRAKEISEFGGRQFIYAGPDIASYGHSQAARHHAGDHYSKDVQPRELVERCLRQVKGMRRRVRLDRPRAHGRLGCGDYGRGLEREAALHRFQTEALAGHFYFMARLTSVTPSGSFVIEPTPEGAWKAFTAWAERHRGVIANAWLTE
jgi:hypothetical protein